MKHTRGNRLLIIGLIAVLVGMLGLCAGCGSRSEQYSGSMGAGNVPDEKDLMTIESSYCMLYYPQKWEGSLQTELVGYNGGAQSVEFYAAFEGQPEIHLFDFVFNRETDYMLGTLNEDGKQVTVAIQSYELDVSNLSEDEKQQLWTMEEDQNVIIEHLMALDGFQPY